MKAHEILSKRSCSVWTQTQTKTKKKWANIKPNQKEELREAWWRQQFQIGVIWKDKKRDVWMQCTSWSTTSFRIIFLFFILNLKKGKAKPEHQTKQAEIIYCHGWSGLGSIKPHNGQGAGLACCFSSIPFICIHNIGVEGNTRTLSHKGARIVKDTQENSLAEDQLPAGSHCLQLSREV